VAQYPVLAYECTCMPVSLANGRAELGTVGGATRPQDVREAGLEKSVVKRVAGDPTDIYHLLRK